MKGVCKICGCTFGNPCFNHHRGFCWWTTKDEDICSHCAKQEIADDPNTIHRVNGQEFPVLSVHQPYALMLVKGKKEFEYRSWKLPEKYVGKRIFIHATRTLDDFNPQFANEEDFYVCRREAFNYNLHTMIIGSVVFGESQGPVDGVMDGHPKLLYKWPVLEYTRLIDPLVNIPGKLGIWKIKF